MEPGVGAQQFQPAVLAKLSRLRASSLGRGSIRVLSVDGGVNAETARAAVAAGANVLIAGSYIFGAQSTAQPEGAFMGGYYKFYNLYRLYELYRRLFPAAKAVCPARQAAFRSLQREFER